MRRRGRGRGRLSITPPGHPAIVLLLLAVPLLAAACSGGPAPKAGPKGGGATTTVPTIPAAAGAKALPLPAACAQVKAALAVQPSATKDPAKHAKDELVPLTEVRTSDPALLGALRSLVIADHELVDAHGPDASATAQIESADKTLATICPGVAA